MYPVVAIAGATGEGKTALAISVAKRTGAVLLPLDQLHRYAFLKEGTGLDVEELAQVTHVGYQLLSPWEVSGPDKYVVWLTDTLRSIAEHNPVVIEGGCTSYLNKLLSCITSPVLGAIKVVAIDTRTTEAVSIERIAKRVSVEKVDAVVEETRILERSGFVSGAGLGLLQECEKLWKHPEHEDPRLAWALRISARVYCPAYLALKGMITATMARERIIKNVLETRSYQSIRVRSVLPKQAIFGEGQVGQLAENLIALLSDYSDRSVGA